MCTSNMSQKWRVRSNGALVRFTACLLSLFTFNCDKKYLKTHRLLSHFQVQL